MTALFKEHNDYPLRDVRPRLSGIMKNSNLEIRTGAELRTARENSFSS